MICNFEYCIFSKNNKCVLEKISLNDLGFCEECIHVTIDEEQLEQMKTHQLKELEREIESTN